MNIIEGQRFMGQSVVQAKVWRSRQGCNGQGQRSDISTYLSPVVEAGNRDPDDVDE